jgi:lipoprotein-releasing system permease protein
VLKALGARPADLVKIFAWDGLVMGLAGSGLGLVIGSALCAALKHSPWLELPKEIYYVDRLPVQMDGADTTLVLAVAVLLSFVSALYPAWMAGKLDAVRALRYE